MSKHKEVCGYCGTEVLTNELGGWDEYHDCKPNLDTPIGGDMGGQYTDQVMEDTRERLTKGIMETWKIPAKQKGIIEEGKTCSGGVLPPPTISKPIIPAMGVKSTNLVEANLQAKIERLEKSIIDACRLADLADSHCCSYHADAISVLSKEWGHILGDRIKDRLKEKRNDTPRTS